ncbi:hypothetical protein C9374_007668 [Naegleria lovaniensis]|uniref:F-box domain-containing protein n=1 Tax=Naegleria lovaniensis TaxID=51637 RepID=A0AA88KGZ0_NAELO|nr:uncharacterized protein C9374_007668 [Naegleria lovaniensis]KAG2379030.1 hypothetical protein C9374_007668 [Naegleria lovaniensis]
MNNNLSKISLIDIVSCNEYFRTEAVLCQIDIEKGIEPLATKRLNNYIHQFMLYLLVNSCPLVTIKETENDYLKNLIIGYACDRLKYLRAKYTNTPIYRHERDTEIFSVISSDDWLSVTGEEIEEADEPTLKKSKMTAHLYTMESFFKSLVFKNFPGNIVNYMYKDICKQLQLARQEILENQWASVYLTFSPVEMSLLINSFFDVHLEILEDEPNLTNLDACLYLLSVGMTTIAEYLVAEMVELASMKSSYQKVLSISEFMSCCYDDELCQVINCGSLVYFPTAFISSRDFVTFCEERPFPMIDSNQHLSALPFELHEIILQFFDDLEQLLNMRLVCKYWNYLIVTSDDIWKHLCFHSLIRHSMFEFATSTSLSLSNFSLVGKGKQITSYLELFFVRINPWIRAKSYCIRPDFTELCFGGAILGNVVEGADNQTIEKPPIEFLKELEKSLYISLNSKSIYDHTPSFDALTFPIGRSKLGGFPEIPTEWESWFYNSNIWSNGDTFIAQINFEDMDTLVSASVLPSHGILYLFITANDSVKTYFYEGDTTKLKPCNMERIPDEGFNSIGDESHPLIFEDSIFYHCGVDAMDEMMNYDNIFSINSGLQDPNPNLFCLHFCYDPCELEFTFNALQFKKKDFTSLKLTDRH